MSVAKKLQPEIKDFVAPSVDWNTRILVVDDEAEIGKAYASVLKPKDNKVTPISSRSSRSTSAESAPENEKYQFDVVVCTSAAEALSHVQTSKAQGRPFAMGFFDVKLGPGMDGVELVKAIHETDPNVLAVFVTAHNDRTIDSISKVVGREREDKWDYMSKPFTDSEILQKARNFISLWNLKKQSDSQAGQLAALNQRVLESERVTSVAAVARGVAHEFGNLLMQITGKAEVSRSKSEDEMRQAFDKIIDASQRASEILDRFNNLSDAKPVVSEKQLYFIDKIMADSMDLMAHQFKLQNIKVCVIKRDKVQAEVNSTSILQVFVNLMINSIHAMGDSGQIDFSVQDLNADYVEVRVRDYGPGVKDEILSRITEPFFTTKGKKGTGLGLAICREIIEIDHGGEFRVQNHSTKGFEVVIKIPKKVSS